MSADATIFLPRLGETMEKGTIVGWQVTPGTDFSRGDVLVEVETDKTVVEVPALGDGTLTEILAEEGAEVPIGAPIARFEGEPFPETETEPETAVPAAPVPEAPVPRRGPPTAAGQLRASPAARRLARQTGTPLATLTGTGPRGRITTDDVRAGAGAAGEPATVNIAGRPMRFLKLGGGRQTPIVLVHGFGGDLYSWLLNHKWLAADRPVYAVDLPGHGGSALDPDACGLDGLGDALAGFLEVMGLGPVHLVGLSMGGAVSLWLASERADRIASLTLIAAAGLGAEANRHFVDTVSSADGEEELMSLIDDLFAEDRPFERDLIVKMARVRQQPGYLDGLKAIAQGLMTDGRQGWDLRARGRGQGTDEGDLGHGGQGDPGRARPRPAGHGRRPHLRRRRPHDPDGMARAGEPVDPGDRGDGLGGAPEPPPSSGPSGHPLPPGEKGTKSPSPQGGEGLG